MPVGIIINSLCVLLGGLAGGLLQKRVPPKLQASLPTVFGFVAITMGVIKIAEGSNLLVVTLSLLVGCIVGECLDIDSQLHTLATKAVRALPAQRGNDEAAGILVLGIVAFCMSGTGFFGALTEGFSGDSSILFSKAGLDFFTAMIFASLAGFSVAALCIPQAVLMLALFGLSSLLYPLMTAQTTACFLAVGGAITLMNGCMMAKISSIKAANALPSLIIVIVLARILTHG